MTIYSIKVEYRKGGSDVFGAYSTAEEAIAALKKIVGEENDEFGGDLNLGTYCSEEESYEIIKLN